MQFNRNVASIGSGSLGNAEKEHSLAAITVTYAKRPSSNDSAIDQAGSGVFAVNYLQAGEVLCLYPGIHNPVPSLGLHSEDSLVFLEGVPTAPSGKTAEENAYVLNLHRVFGGYLLQTRIG